NSEGVTRPGDKATERANPDASGTSSRTKEISGKGVDNDLIGEEVYNEKGEKIGDIKDVVLGPDGKATNVVIGAGGFLGMGQHDVAIPFSSVTQSDDKLVLSGYTKDQLKELPEAKVTQ